MTWVQPLGLCLLQTTTRRTPPPPSRPWLDLLSMSYDFTKPVMFQSKLLWEYAIHSNASSISLHRGCWDKGGVDLSLEYMCFRASCSLLCFVYKMEQGSALVAAGTVISALSRCAQLPSLSLDYCFLQSFRSLLQSTYAGNSVSEKRVFANVLDELTVV